MSLAVRGVLPLLLFLGTAVPAKGQSASSTTPTVLDAPMPSFGSLFTQLPSDFRRMPTITNGIVLGSAGGLALAVHPGDRTTSHEMLELLKLEEFLDPGGPVGNGIVQGGGAFAVYAFGRFSHEPDVAVLGADLVRAQIVSGALTHGIKAAAQRDRPDGGRNSFPSGHSAASFATASVLQRHFGWRVGLPTYGLATYAAVARLSENQHFLSDVVFGAGIGIVSGRAVTIGRSSHSFVVSPMVGSGSFGIGFTSLGSRGPA